MNVLRKGFGVFITRIWTAAVSLILSIVVARAFGADGKGVASLILLLPTLLGTFGNAGLHIANVYLYGKRGARIEALAANSIWVALVLGLVVTGLSLALYPLLGPRLFAGVPGSYLLAVTLLTPAMLVCSYFGNLLLATRRINAFNLTVALQTALQLVTVLAAVYIFDAGVVAVVYGLVANLLFGAVVSLVLVYRTHPFGWHFERGLFRESIRYGLKGYLANALQFLNYRSDVLIVSYFLGTVAVGWYSVAVNFAEILWYVPTALGTILFPVVATSAFELANQTTARISRQTVLLMTFASAGVALACPWLIPKVFGPEFEPAVNALLVLLPGVLIFSVAKILGNDFSGRGLVVTNSVISGLALVANVGLNILFIPRLGINGAALSSTITYSLATIVLVILFARHTKTPIGRVVLPENGDVMDLVRSARFKKRPS
ncbi:MAG: flippase [Candidatus Andersenbacteria bacterium]